MESIKGLVRNSNDAPLQDVNVVIVTGPGHQDIAAVTGADGAFAFGNLSPGSYVIKAFGQGVESDQISVRVFPRKTAVVEIWLEQGNPEPTPRATSRASKSSRGAASRIGNGGNVVDEI